MIIIIEFIINTTAVIKYNIIDVASIKAAINYMIGWKSTGFIIIAKITMITAIKFTIIVVAMSMEEFKVGFIGSFSHFFTSNPFLILHHSLLFLFYFIYRLQNLFLHSY